MPGTETIPAPATPHDLLIAVRNVIMDNPERHNQGSWINSIFDGPITATIAELRDYALLPLPEDPENPDNPICGTTACVAGWAVILGDNTGKLLTEHAGGYIQMRATQLLNLDGCQADALFAGNRTRGKVLAMLTALIRNPDADLYEILKNWKENA